MMSVFTPLFERSAWYFCSYELLCRTLSVFSSDILTWGADIWVYIQCQGRTQGGGLGLNSPLELDILQKLYYLRKGH